MVLPVEPDGLGVRRGERRVGYGRALALPGLWGLSNRDDNVSVNIRRQEPAPDLIRGLAAGVEGTSDGRMSAVPGEASTRQMSPGAWNTTGPGDRLP